MVTTHKQKYTAQTDKQSDTINLTDRNEWADRLKLIF